MIHLDDNLWVTQEWLRKACQIESMVRHVHAGGYWTRQVLDDWAEHNRIPRKSPLIQVNQFEDGLRMLQDGHHRCVASLFGGRTYIASLEYEIQHGTYGGYLEVLNLETGWCTPYDPRTEVRLDDIAPYKAEVRRLLASDTEAAREYILKHKALYVVPRRIKSIVELAELVRVDRNDTVELVF